MSYSQKKKDLAAKGMPDPKVGKNVTEGDTKAELGPCKICGGKHKTIDHKKST